MTRFQRQTKEKENFEKGRGKKQGSNIKLMQNEMRNIRETKNRLEKIRIQRIQKEKDKNLRENRNNLKTQIFIHQV